MLRSRLDGEARPFRRNLRFAMVEPSGQALGSCGSISAVGRPDLNEFMNPAEHWKGSGKCFDALYFWRNAFMATSRKSASVKISPCEMHVSTINKTIVVSSSAEHIRLCLHGGCAMVAIRDLRLSCVATASSWFREYQSGCVLSR
jgi:hypothetical protein